MLSGRPCPVSFPVSIVVCSYVSVGTIWASSAISRLGELFLLFSMKFMLFCVFFGK